MSKKQTLLKFLFIEVTAYMTAYVLIGEISYLFKIQATI